MPIALYRRTAVAAWMSRGRPVLAPTYAVAPSLPLHRLNGCACAQDIVRELLAAGADPLVGDTEGKWTPLHAAARANQDVS
jgi:ankyrin repeat protein